MVKKQIKKVSLIKWIDATHDNLTIGTRVTIRPGSRFEGGFGNPSNGHMGTIIHLDPVEGSVGWYRVEWDNGREMNYQTIDLLVYC